MLLAATRALLRSGRFHARLSPFAPTLVALQRPFATSLQLNLPSGPSTSPARRISRREDRDSDGPARDSYQLASQVRRLVQQGKGDTTSALTLVRSTPPDVATVVVWNVLLNATLVAPAAGPAAPGATHAQAVRKAYDVWMEMKRRGITPSARGYGTVLTGIAKRAKLALEDASRGRRKAEGWNAELRAKVDIIYRQWQTHCERVLEKSEAGTGDLVSGTGLVGLDGVEAEVAGRDAEDGRADTAADLTAVPTNQYLSFLASSLSLSTLSVASLSSSAVAPASTTTPIAGPAILKQLLQTFDSISNADELSQELLSRLHKTGATYSILLGALRSALQASCAQTGSTPTSDSSSAWPAAPELLNTALEAWTQLVAHPPAPDDAAPTSTASGLNPVIPTQLLALFLIPSSSVLPSSCFSRAVAVAQSAFGFVPPAELSALEGDANLPAPLCAPLDAPGLGVALRVLAASGRKDWVKGWWEQVRDYPARFELDSTTSEQVRGREEGEVVIRACGASGDVDGITDILNYLLSPSLRLSPLHRPDISTFTIAMTSLARIGSPAAVDASLRTWSVLLSTLDPTPSPSIKPFYAPAADALLRCALATRDRGQVWRAIKAVSLPTSESRPDLASVSEASAAPSSAASTSGSVSSASPFSPAAFPPAASEPRATKAGTIALSQSLALALSRILAPSPSGRDSLAPGSVPPSRRAELERWSERISTWATEAVMRDSEVPGGEERREGEGEMEWRRRMVALKRARARTAAGADTGPGGRKDAVGRTDSKSSPREDGKPQHTERRRQWWSARQEEWAQGRAEREETGAGRRTARDSSSRRSDRGDGRAPRWDSGRREERRVRFGHEERQGGRRDQPAHSAGGFKSRARFDQRDEHPRSDRRASRPTGLERRDDRSRRLEVRDGRTGRTQDGPLRQDGPSRRSGQRGWDD